MPSAPIPPAGDTGPIDEDKLLDTQRDLLKALYQRLRGFSARLEQAPSRTKREKLPWTPIVDERPNQVLMLDGVRGTGKTSLLLTALKTWRDAGAPWSVLALDPVDFDPMPEGMSPFGWVVLSIRRLIDWMEADDPERPRRDWFSEEAEDASLDSLWKLFFRRAEIGWSASARQADIEDFIERSEEKQRGWLRLQGSWQSLIDATVASLIKRGKLHPHGIILQPIDDLDLAPRRARELLLALRQLHHERVVFLLTGDVTHLEKVVGLRQFKAEWVEGAQGPQNSWRRTQALAHDLIDKVIPPVHRLEVRPLSPVIALDFAARRAGFVDLDKDKTTIPKTVEYLAACLAEGSSDAGDHARREVLAARIVERMSRGDDQRGFRVRDLINALDAHPFRRVTEPSGTPRFEGAEHAAGNLRAFLESARVRRESDAQMEAVDLSALKSAQLFVRARGDSKPTLNPAVRIVSGFEAVWLGEYGDERALTVVEETLIELKGFGKPQWTVFAGRSPLIMTVLELEDGQTATIPWPGVVPTSLQDALTKAGRLDGLIDAGLRPIHAWLICHLEWFGVETVGPDVTAEDALNRLGAAEQTPQLAEWLRNELPVLCAPEHGLEEPIVGQILRLVRGFAGADWLERQARLKESRAAWLRKAAPTLDGDGWMADIDGENREHLWHALAVMGPGGAWYDLPGADGHSLSNQLFGIRPAHGSNTLSLHDALVLPVEHGRPAPNWATRTITEILVRQATLGRFARRIRQIIEQAPGRWGAHYLVQIWKALVELGSDEAVETPWLEIAPNEVDVVFAGPSMVIEPSWVLGVTVQGHGYRVLDGWSLEYEPVADELVAWLCVVQAYASRLTEPPQDLGVGSVRPSDRLAPWPEVDWHRAEVGLSRWRRTVEAIARATAASDAVKHDMLTYGWLVTTYNTLRPTYRSEHLRPDVRPVEAVDVGYLLDNVRTPDKGSNRASDKVFRRWVRANHHTSPFEQASLTTAWDAWWAVEDTRREHAAIKAIARMSIEDLRAVGVAASPANLIVGFFAKGASLERLADLANIPDVGAGTVAELEQWAEENFS